MEVWLRTGVIWVLYLQQLTEQVRLEEKSDDWFEYWISVSQYAAWAFQPQGMSQSQWRGCGNLTLFGYSSHKFHFKLNISILDLLYNVKMRLFFLSNCWKRHPAHSHVLQLMKLNTICLSNPRKREQAQKGTAEWATCAPASILQCALSLPTASAAGKLARYFLKWLVSMLKKHWWW